MEAHESCEVSSTVKAALLDDATPEAEASSNGRFFVVSQERELSEDDEVASADFPSKHDLTSNDESEQEEKECEMLSETRAVKSS